MGDGSDGAFAGGDEIICRTDTYALEFLYVRSGYGVYEAQAFDLVAEELYAHRLVRAAQKDVYDVSVHAECAALEIRLRAAVEGVYQLVQQAGEGAALPFHHFYCLGVEVLGVADAVQTADA